MDFWETDSQQCLRRHVRRWLNENRPADALPSMSTAEGFEAHRRWERALYRDGWSVVSWPEAYGGRGLSMLDWLVFEEEYRRCGAPGRVNQSGLFILGPTIQTFGSEAQKRRYLPAMARGDEIWAQAWSEPDAGSDLAAIRCRATRVGEEYVISGHKTWASRAAFADWCFGLFRTDPLSERHEGLSHILVPLNANGITIRPIPQLDGETRFAEIFFDDVRVPIGNRIGDEGGGWRIAMETAGLERGMLLRSPAHFQQAAAELIRLAQRNPQRLADGTTRDLLSCWMRAESYTLSAYLAASRLSKGEGPGPETSGNKLFWSQLDQSIHGVALDILGSPLAVDTDSDTSELEKWHSQFLFSLAGGLYAGTTEIQKTIIAKQVLGLPG